MRQVLKVCTSPNCLKQFMNGSGESTDRPTDPNYPQESLSRLKSMCLKSEWKDANMQKCLLKWNGLREYVFSEIKCRILEINYIFLILKLHSLAGSTMTYWYGQVQSAENLDVMWLSRSSDILIFLDFHSWDIKLVIVYVL